MLLQRKNESRDASSRSLMRYGVSGGDAGWILLDAEQELRAHQHRGQRHLDAGVEASVRACLPVQLERPLQVGVCDRTPIGPPHERASGSAWRGVFIAGSRGPRYENAAAAGRVTRTAGDHTDR